MNGTWLAARPVNAAQTSDHEAPHLQPAPVVVSGDVPSAQSPQQQPRQQHCIHGRERHGCMGINQSLHLRLKQHCPFGNRAAGF